MTTQTEDPGLEALKRQIESAEALVRENRIDEAIEAFTGLVERWPHLDVLYPVLCNLKLVAGHADPEPEWIEKAVRHDPSLRSTFHDVATRLLADGSTERAKPFLVALAAGAPDDAGLRHELGAVHFRLGDHAAAETEFRAALAADPGRAEAEKSLAHLLLSTGRGDDARTQFADRPERLAEAAAPAGAREAAISVPDPSAGGIEVRCEPLVARGPVREVRVRIRSDRPSKPRVLSLDVYPSERPEHPARHHGYWNREIEIPRGDEVVVHVAWNGPEKTVTFDGRASTSHWHGAFEEDGEYVLGFVVYEDDRPVAREYVKQWIGRPRLESALWFQTYRCNMKCPYCWEVQRIAKGELKPDPFLPADRVARAWNRLLPGILDLTGGEPFLQPDFLDMLDALDDRIRIAITTNLSFDMTEFAQRISPEKVFSMTLSLHPTQRLKFEHFLGRALLLKNRGFRLTVNYVAWPEQLWLIPKYKEMVEREGLRFHVDPYAATPHFPFEFTAREKDFLRPFLGDDRKGHWFGEVDKTPVLCSGGFEHLNVQPNGDAYRCIGDKIWNRRCIGNIFDEDFSLNEDWTPCGDYWRCPACDKDKIQVERIEGE